MGGLVWAGGAEKKMFKQYHAAMILIADMFFFSFDPDCWDMLGDRWRANMCAAIEWQLLGSALKSFGTPGGVVGNSQ